MVRSLFDHAALRVYQAAIGFVVWLEESVPVITSNVSAAARLPVPEEGISHE
jgi:hypothetical protein